MQTSEMLVGKLRLSAVNASLSSAGQHEQIKGYCATGGCVWRRRSCVLVIIWKTKPRWHKPKGRLFCVSHRCVCASS